MKNSIVADNLGFCFGCGIGVQGVEPDAREYECESCGEYQVYGAEELSTMFGARQILLDAKRGTRVMLHEKSKYCNFLSERGWKAILISREHFPDGRDGYLFRKDKK